MRGVIWTTIHVLVNLGSCVDGVPKNEWFSARDLEWEMFPDF